MTTVRSAPRFNVLRKWARARMSQRSRGKVSPESVSGVIYDASEPPNKDTEDASFCGEPFADDGELLSSLSPLLFSMKVFGLYFQREDPLRRRADDPEWNPPTPATGTASPWLRIYSTVVLTFVWLNAVRFASVFSIVDQFGAVLLSNIMFFSWFCLIAIIQTACYVACHTGKLLKVLTTVRVTKDCVTSARRFALVSTVLCWMSIAIDSVSVAYLVFSDDEYDFLFAPLFTSVQVPEDRIAIVKVVGYLVVMHAFPIAFVSHATNLIIVYVFYSQYKKLTETGHCERRLFGDGDGNEHPRSNKMCPRSPAVEGVLNRAAVLCSKRHRQYNK